MSAEFVDINLLPRPARVPMGGAAWQRRLLPGLVALLLAVLFLGGALLIKGRNDRLIAAQQADVLRTQQEVATLAGVLAEVEVAKQQVETLARQSEQLEADAHAVARNNRAFSPLLQTLTESLLPRMRLTALVEEQPGRFRVQGEAGSTALVSEYVNALRGRPGIGRVTPQSVEQLSGTALPGTVRWILIVEP